MSPNENLINNVTIIPPTKRSVQNVVQLKQQQNIRVAAYCRVSTGDETQQSSYTTQKAFYTSMIATHSDWKLAGIYADEALSGTSRIHREEFNRMMEDAKAGKIDYIISKSISRFARNTVDTLTCIRQLRQQNPPVGVYFEKENIDTLDAKGELILTILSALAQDESRSISDNIRWSFQKNFQAGKPHLNLKRMLGYDKDKEGNWIIVPEQAKIVHYIFEHFVCGQTANGIARDLNSMGKTTINGKKWTAGSILIILRNEKYVGDLEMQKTITKDFLTHRSTRNNGEAPKYYIQNHHVKIIDRTTWNKAQAMLSSQPSKLNSVSQKEKRVAQKSLFSNLICGAKVSLPNDNTRGCRSPFFRIIYTGIANDYTDERSLTVTGGNTSLYLEKYTYSYPLWRCKRKTKKYREETVSDNHSIFPIQASINNSQPISAPCTSQSLHECAIEQSFMEMLYHLKFDYESNLNASYIYMLFKETYENTFQKVKQNHTSVERIESIESQINELEQTRQMLLQKQNSSAREIEFKLKDVSQKMEHLQRERNRLETEQDVLAVMKKNFDFFIDCLKELPRQNQAGTELKINGLNTSNHMTHQNNISISTQTLSEVNSYICEIDSSLMEKAPDLLQFEKGIYCAFIEKGIVYGDEITYQTNFGVTLKTLGNSRTLNHFLGYKKCRMDGTVVFIDAPYKIYDYQIQYKRYLDGRKQRKTPPTPTALRNHF